MAASPKAISAPTGRLAWRLDAWLLCSLLLGLLPLLTLLQPGLPHTADGQVHLLRTFEVTRLLREGVLYPRWAPDFYLGYGYPFFNFYAPGAHVAAGLLALAGLGVVRAVVLLQAVALLLYPVGAYLAARAILPGDRNAAGPAALLAAALYLYAPLRFRELFVQGNLSQWLALGLLPWCAWLLAGVARRGGYGRAVSAGVLLAALLYAHHPSAFLAWPALFAYALTLAVIAKPVSTALPGMAGDVFSLRSRLLAVAASFALAAALAAPFWLPSIAELPDANLEAIASGSFSARLNLLPLSELLALPVVQDNAALNPPMPNSLGSAQVLLAILGLLISLKWAAGWPRAQTLAGARDAPPDEDCRFSGLALLAVGALLLLSVALMLPAAALVWEALPLARLIAFPWRLLGPALLWAALLGGAALYWLPGHLRGVVVAGLLLLVPLSVAPYLFPRPFAPASEPDLAGIARYELGGGAAGTASANEYLPRWVTDSHPPATLAEDHLAGRSPARLDPASLPAGSQATLVVARGLEDRYRLELAEPAAIRLRRFYFPGWQAWIDGRPVEVTATGPYGLVTVEIPAGQHELRLSFESTPARTAGKVLAAAGAACAVLAGWRRRGARMPRLTTTWPGGKSHRPAWAAAGVIVILAFLKTGVVGPYTTWFRQQSAADEPAGMQHAVHARFANGVELLGYSLPAAEARQGGTLAVRLYWRAWQPVEANARPFLHADAVSEELTWANQTKLNAGDKPMVSWPPGFFVVDDYQLPIPLDAPPVVARLRAGLSGPGGELVPPVAGGDLVTLGPIRIREQAPLATRDLPNRDQIYRFGSAVQLVGHQVGLLDSPPALEVTLYWQAQSPVPADYTVFLHVLGSDGRLIAQGDGPPVHGWYPTSLWAPGQVIADTHTIALPAGVARPADLRVMAGLYTLGDGRRAAVASAAGTPAPDDQVLLARPR